MAAPQWSQQYQQYQQQPQYYQPSQQHAQSPRYAQGQQYQQPQHYQHNQQYQAQQYQSQQQPQGYPVQPYQHNQQYQVHHHQQPQQGQPTQQYQQARQAPPVAEQYPQLQPSQSLSQYPQPQSHQPQQAFNSYQHQNTPRQRPLQRYPSQQQSSASQNGSPSVHTSPQQPLGLQQHGTFQHGAYQQAYQPQRSTSHAQSPPQTGPQPCFNCGNSGHFAMDCPEPIRAVPAGKANPQAFQNPLRRPKTASTAVNPPPYTPHPNHAQASPKGYPSSPYGQAGYPQPAQYQQAHSPTSSVSAHSPAQGQYYQQWQQYYQSQQAYQQGNHYQQGSPYHQQPNTAAHGQATGYPNGPQTPSQTPAQVLQYNSSTHAYQSQSAPTSASPVQLSQHTLSNHATTQPDQRTQFLAPMKSGSSSSSPQNIEAPDYGFEEDDLKSLDIPDLPSTRLLFANVSRHPITLISQPLPGNFIVADALAPFPSPAPQDRGCCKSKFLDDAILDACLEHFKRSKYWDKEHADDVIFSDFPADSNVVPIDEILTTIRLRRTHPESSDEFNRDSRSQSRTVPMNQDSLNLKSTIMKMERELSETKAKLQAKLDKGRAAKPVNTSPLRSVKSEQPHLRNHEIQEDYQTPPQSVNSEKPIKSEQDAEDVLAALGVTGAPKPVTALAWPDPTVHDSPSDKLLSRNGSSPRADTVGENQHRLESNPGEAAPEHHINGSTSSQRSAPPPSRPVPFGLQSYPGVTDGSPLSAGLTDIDHPESSTKSVEQSNGDNNGFFSPPTDGQAPSPTEIRSEKSQSRKRYRDSPSDEEDTAKRRQEDDYTPKFKKRQPKVAEAYSRRW